MLDVQTIKISIPLKKEFVVAGGGTATKTNLLVILNNRYSGEAASSVYYGPSLEKIEADLRRGISYISRHKEIGPETLQAISGYKIHAIARSALVAMVLNFISGETGKYPWEVLELGAPVGIKNSITIGLADPRQMIEAAKESDYPIVKIKMGGDGDAELITQLNEVTGKEIRIDANGGWTPEQAEEMIHHLAQMGITVIEQPTSSEHVSDWPHLKGNKEDVELILDEGMNSLDDYSRYTEFVDGVNIKMEKSGGILEAIKIARQARDDKKKVMLGCMVESSVGIAQSVYMSSLADYHDLDSPQLLENDIAQGIIYDRDTIHVDREIIGGPSLKRDLLEKYINE